VETVLVYGIQAARHKAGGARRENDNNRMGTRRTKWVDGAWESKKPQAGRSELEAIESEWVADWGYGCVGG
jgi:hypothetical protein